MVSPDSRANLARRQAETPLSALCRFPGPALKIMHRIRLNALSRATSGFTRRIRCS
jgi:hypothetical protein